MTQDKEGTTYRYDLSGDQVLNWEPWASEPFFPSYATIETAEAAFNNVLCDVGCNQPELDNHDTRIIQETLLGTTTFVGSKGKKKGIIDHEDDSEGFAGLNIIEAQREANWDTDQDGIPDWYEKVTAGITKANNAIRDMGGNDAGKGVAPARAMRAFFHFILMDSKDCIEYIILLVLIKYCRFC